MNLSATVCVSRDTYPESLNTLINLNNPDELCLSPNTNYKHACSEYNADICIECTPEHPWSPYGRHQLYDAASGDWYLTLDDDDLAVEPLRPHLTSVDDDVGLVFGDVIMRWQGRGGLTHREELRRNDEDFNPLRAVYWHGGYYALRAEAWEDVREVMNTSRMVHGDTRLFYWLLKCGWSWYRVPEWCEVVRLRGRSVDWERYTPGWPVVYEALEDGQSPDEWLIKDPD